MKKNYLVTVGITTYNSNINYLSEAIDSIINQSYRNLEIIIYDDCSSNSKDIENLIIRKKDDRIFFLKSEKNMGVSNSLNEIIKKANGDFFCWCPDDDYMSLSRIQRQIRSVEKNPDFISYSNHYQLVEMFNLKRKINHNLYLKFFDLYLYSVIFDRINGGTLLIPSNIIKKYKFNSKLKHIQDYDVWHQMFRDNKSIYINEYLFFSRKHVKQASNLNSNEAENEISDYYINFIKKNLFNLIHYYGKNGFFIMYTCFVFRKIIVHKFISNKSTVNRYINPFYNSNKIFYALLSIAKLVGLFLQFFKSCKNIILYKFIYNKIFPIFRNK